MYLINCQSVNIWVSYYIVIALFTSYGNTNALYLYWCHHLGFKLILSIANKAYMWDAVRGSMQLNMIPLDQVLVTLDEHVLLKPLITKTVSWINASNSPSHITLLSCLKCIHGIKVHSDTFVVLHTVHILAPYARNDSALLSCVNRGYNYAD